MLRLSWALLSGLLLEETLALDISVIPNSNNRLLRKRRNISCELFLEDTLFGERGRTVEERESIRCAVLNEESGGESDDLYPINRIPIPMIRLIKKKLGHGKVFATLPGAHMNHRGHILLANITQPLRFVKPPEHLQRHLLEGWERPQLGVRDVTICRISTKDSEPKDSASALKKGLFGKGANFQSQFKKCSFGQLKWVLSEHGVIDVKLPETSEFYDNDRQEMISHAHRYIKEKYGISSVSELSDRVLMCLPPSTGTWAAEAGVGHWRAQFHSDWCMSLSGTMHEIGHTLGLRHANKDGAAYADLSGYMSSGSKVPGWPMKCFNGFNNWKLGFFKTRHLKLSPLESEPLKITVASFMDYPKSNVYEPVVVSLDNIYFLQYNKAKKFNKDTGLHRNMLVITAGLEGGESESMGGVAVKKVWSVDNYNSSGRKLVIRVCRRVQGHQYATERLEVAIGIGEAPCKLEVSKFKTGEDSSAVDGEEVPEGTATSVGPTRPYRYRKRRGSAL